MSAVELMNERPAYVDFEYIEEEDRAATVEKGHYVPRFTLMARITPPGGKLTHCAPAEEWVARKEDDARKSRDMDASRVAQHYRFCLEQFKQNEEIPLNGTPIKTWAAVSPMDIARILRANIRTVEDLASCNEEARMAIGAGSQALKDKAVLWLKQAADGKAVLSLQSALTAVEGLKHRIEQLEEENKSLRARLEDDSLEPPRKRGRPAKAKGTDFEFLEGDAAA